MKIETPKDNRIVGIQYCRAFAAVAVVLYHLGTTWSALEQKSVLIEIFKYGHLGVDFFFVLSGFIIYKSHSKDLGEVQSATIYAKKRFFRIYPTFFIVITIKVLIFTLLGIQLKEEQQSINYFVSSFLLIPIEGQFPFLSVSWTLCHELTFYIFFIFSILFGYVFFKFSVSFWAISIFLNNYNLIEVNFVLDHFLSPYNIQFIIGILIGLSLERKKFINNYFNLIIGITLILSSIYLEGELLIRILTGLGFGLLTLASISIKPSISSIFKTIDKILLILGNASYSIYLIHTLILTALYRILFNSIGINTLSFISFFASITGGIIFWKYIESPLLSYSKKKFIFNK